MSPPPVGAPQATPPTPEHSVMRSSSRSDRTATRAVPGPTAPRA
jgi:hypothetical protein